MGLRILDVNFIFSKLKKKQYKKILILGYQATYFNDLYLNFIRNKFGYQDYENNVNINKNIDQIDSVELFKLISNDIDIMDVSAYEGANIVYDLSSDPKKLPLNLYDKYDLIIDWGTSEHVFNIICCYLNIFDMLKNGGEYLCLTPMNSMPDHGYYQISPNFYYDFFQKLYTNLSINILENRHLHTPEETWILYKYTAHCIDHLVNIGIDNNAYFNFVQCIKDDNFRKDQLDVIYQYQFVEHWSKKNNFLKDQKRNESGRYRFLGFEFIANIETNQIYENLSPLKLDPIFVLKFEDCI
jgi:SAM-dependent methyltransferase